MALPEFGCEDSEERAVTGDRGEAGAVKSQGVIGEVGSAKTGEEAEGEVEEADKGASGEAKGAGWDAEVGENPEGAGGEVGCDADGELVELGLGEAVEEEVGGYEVVGAGGLEGKGVGWVGCEAARGGGSCGLATLAEEVEHGGAEIDGIGVEVRVAGEQIREKSAVPVAEYESAAGIEELREEVQAAAMEGGAEGEVFEPAIRAS